MTGQQEWQPWDRAWADNCCWVRRTAPDGSYWWGPDGKAEAPRTDAEMTAAGAVLLVRDGRPVGCQRPHVSVTETAAGPTLVRTESGRRGWFDETDWETA